MRSIENWQYTVHELNKRKGFYDYERDIKTLDDLIHDKNWGLSVLVEHEREALSRILADYKTAMLERKVLLAISELCEAHEELRAGHAPGEIYYKADNPQKPEGFLIEMADTHIRMLDIQQSLGADAEYAMTVKHEYNETRSHKHGKQF